MIRINQLVEKGKSMKNTFRELQFVIRLLIDQELNRRADREYFDGLLLGYFRYEFTMN